MRVFILICLVAGALTCSSKGGLDVAGGTGTGNPPVVASRVMIVADTVGNAEALGKTAFDLPVNLDSIVGPHRIPQGPFSITDGGGLRFNVTAATILVQRVYFMFSDVADSLFAGNRFPDLKRDSSGIWIEGPFVFDALSGSCTPSLDSILIPAARCTGLRLLIAGRRSVAPVHAGAVDSPIRISGTFNYNDTAHTFRMNLETNALLTYSLGNDSAELLTNATPALFLLKLQANSWLDSINLRACLMSGNTSFDPDGNLSIGENSGIGPCRGVEAQIRGNILNSGRLDIF